MDQEKYWDSVSEKKEFPTPFQIDKYQKIVKKENNVLDVGCGYGRTLNELYEIGYRNLYGVDFSQGMIDRGKIQYPFLNIQKNTNDTLPYSGNSFDSVILIAVLTCIYDNESQENLLTEIKRVLKPNGVLYINDYLINSDERNINRYKKFEQKYNNYGVFELPEGALVRHHKEDYVLHLLKDFYKYDYKKVVYTTMNGNKSNGFYYLGKNNAL